MPNPSTSESQTQLLFRAVHMGLFQTLGSIQEVVDLGRSKLPISNENELISLLMTMQNTVLINA